MALGPNRAAVAVLAVLVTHCTTSPAQNCEDECAPNEACLDGACHRLCNFDADCGADQACRGGTCQTADCGNGIPERDEACDDHNKDSADGCSDTCIIEPGFCCLIAGTACVADGAVNPANTCLVCDADASQTAWSADIGCQGTSCATAGDCAGGESCECADQTCAQHLCSPVPCPCQYNADGDDTCDGNLVAGTHCPQDASFCNGIEECNGDGECIHAGDPCVGGPVCDNLCDETADSCRLPAGTPCADDRICNGIEACDGDGNCSATTPADDGTPCDEDAGADGNVCNSACQSGICADGVAANQGEICGDDGVYCNGLEVCDGAGVCMSSGNPCAGVECQDTCNETLDNCYSPATTPCTDDGSLCNGPERCDGNGNCTPIGGIADGTACDGGDGDVCNFSCQAGACSSLFSATAGEPCDDAFACTAPAGDTCDGAGTCRGAPDHSFCINGGLGDLCEPACAETADGCLSRPTAIALDCPDIVAPSNQADCTLTLTGGTQTGQAGCLTCNAKIGKLVLDRASFTGSAGTTCDPNSWTVVSGNNCLGDPTDCPPPGGPSHNCCDELYCHATHGWVTDRRDCNRGRWRIEQHFDTRGITDLQICFDYGDRGATETGGDDDGVWIGVDNGSLQFAYCDLGGPRQFVDNALYRTCVDLDNAVAAEQANLNISFLTHSSHPGEAIFINNIEVTGWTGGCLDTPTVFSDNFDACDLSPWNVIGSPMCEPVCDTSALEAKNAEWAISTTVDTTALDDDVELCFAFGDDGSTSPDSIVVEYHDGSTWSAAFGQTGNMGGPNGSCEPLCVNLSHHNPLVNNNPALGMMFTLKSHGDNRLMFLDDVRVRGARHCADANGYVSFTAPTDLLAGKYEITASTTHRPLAVDIRCYWNLDPALEARDTVYFMP